MFEIIYISPSCKQSVNFIKYLAIELKQRGIDGFDIDRKNIQLKSDKFIVSAVDIWGGMLGRGFSKVKYYINDIRIEEYKDERTSESVAGKLKYLKSGFREGTKEISEEELIKILKKG